MGKKNILAVDWAGAVSAVAAVIVVLMLISQQSGPSGDGKVRPVTYVAIGASDVVGVGADDPVNHAWVARIYQRLPRGSKFLRLGVEGSTAAQAAAEQLPAAEEAQADLITVWLAVNDFVLNAPLESYEGALDWIVSRSTGAGGRLFLGNIPDLTSTPAFDEESPDQLSARIDRWNLAIARVARRHDAVLVDLFAASRAVAGEAAELVAEDGFHPSSLGYQVLAEIFWSAITEDPVIGPVVDAG